MLDFQNLRSLWYADYDQVLWTLISFSLLSILQSRYLKSVISFIFFPSIVFRMEAPSGLWFQDWYFLFVELQCKPILSGAVSKWSQEVLCLIHFFRYQSYAVCKRAQFFDSFFIQAWNPVTLPYPLLFCVWHSQAQWQINMEPMCHPAVYLDTQIHQSLYQVLLPLLYVFLPVFSGFDYRN